MSSTRGISSITLKVSFIVLPSQALIHLNPGIIALSVAKIARLKIMGTSRAVKEEV